jgi:hypothetical protein
MILEPKRKNFKGTLQVKETVLKILISGAMCQYLGLLNEINLR